MGPTWITERLAGHFDRKVRLVPNRHSAHGSRQVRIWLADHPDRIELRILPPTGAEPRRAGQR
ncbi:hypothetical protein [Streptomyces sp. MUSC 14]|uniref:hypothetical protein n=1 Tax=Streptomyces sp. MUSC 14 TaxID=1354889 RepID=UPI0026BF8C1D